LHKTYFTVSENAATIPGTTANLKTGQRIKIFDLIHALMLPSGNDAAITLAENFGEHIIKVRGLKVPNRAKLATPNPEKLRDAKPDA
jgi:serine-type D-Ala-D-Ala carboxypeptidase (penicillin-binding protein 5/6)